ncbi:hypothetical protein BGZ58_001318 [Dissophora ornata]|nr:hypothetical protein BGZ58_001318 [Dissophora ornata]
MVGTPGDRKCKCEMKLVKEQPYPAYFVSFVGYGEFLPVPLSAADNDDNEDSSIARSKTAAPIGSMFVACNGIYLDVFKIKSDGEWDRKHSISLKHQVQGPKFRGVSKIAISPDESIVTLASADGNLTTYFARTGIAIHNKKFPGYKIEHGGFNGHDDRVFLTLRNSATFILETRILDTLRLNSEIATGKTPIPIIDTSILSSFPQKDFLERGIVFEAAQSKINCYIVHQPTPPPEFTKDSSTKCSNRVVEFSKYPGSYTSPLSYPRYELNVSVHEEVDQEGDGTKYWPKVETKSPSGGVGSNWWDVRDYYLEIETAKIYSENGDISAEIKVMESSSDSKETHTHMVFISENIKQGTRHAFQDCYWSIRLLVATYVFSTQGCKKKTKDLNTVKLTYEEHTEAVVRFTMALVNRVMPGMDVQTKEPTSNNGVLSRQPTSPTESTSFSGAIAVGDSPRQDDQKIEHNSEANETVQPKVAMLLTFLLSDICFQETNHIFVEGLLTTPDCNWIPRADKSLNPIKLVIKANNERLLKVSIDYCIKRAKTHHPAYMTPVIQCSKLISDLYPDILSDMFRKASYVPVHNHHYVVSHAQVANITREDWINFAIYYLSFKNKTREARDKSQDIGDYTRPVFCLLSQ